MGGVRPARPPLPALRPFRAFAPNLTLPSHFAVGWSARVGEFAFHAAGRGLTPPFSFPIARGRADRATSISNSIFVALWSLSFPHSDAFRSTPRASFAFRADHSLHSPRGPLRARASRRGERLAVMAPSLFPFSLSWSTDLPTDEYPDRQTDPSHPSDPTGSGDSGLRREAT